MIEIVEGGVYEAALVRGGISSIGPWQMVKVADPKSKKGGATFFTDPIVEGLVDRNMIRIVKFKKATVKNKLTEIKTTKTKEWITVTDNTFEIEKVGEGSGGFHNEDDFYGGVDTSGELPF